MLIVELSGVGCYGNPGTTFRFDRGVTLLHGTSGCGKSTVFRAIDWALYGKPGGIYKNGMTTSKVTVRLGKQSDCLTIVRERGKSKLVVQNGTTQWRGEAAQQYIISIFGSRERWMSSSYVVQGEKNVLFGLSKVEKSRVLSWCHGVEPTSVIAAFKRSEKNKLLDHQQSRLRLDAEYGASARIGVQLQKNVIIQDKDVPEHVNVNLFGRLLREAGIEKTRVVEIERRIAGVDKSLDDSTKHVAQYRSDLSGAMSVSGLCPLGSKNVYGLNDTNLISRNHLLLIIRSTQISMIQEANKTLLQLMPKVNSSSRAYTASDLSGIDKACRLWTLYEEAVIAWRSFKKTVDVSDVTMEDYAVQCRNTLRCDRLIRSLTICTSTQDIAQLQHTIDEYDNVGIKPIASDMLQSFRSQFGIPTDQLEIIIDNHDELAVIVQKPQFAVVRTDSLRYGVWLDLEKKQQAKNALYIGWISSSVRNNAIEMFGIVSSMSSNVITEGNGTKDMVVQPGDTVDVILSKFGLSEVAKASGLQFFENYIMIVRRSGTRGTMPELIDDEDYKIAKALIYIEQYEAMSTDRWIDVEEYNRLVQIHCTQDELSRLNITEQDAARFEAHIKKLPYTCKECGYTGGAVAEGDHISNKATEGSHSSGGEVVGSNHTGSHDGHVNTLNLSNVNKYMSWRSLGRRLESMNVTDSDREKMGRGITVLSMDNNKSRAMDKHRSKYDAAVVTSRNGTNQPETRLLTLVSRLIGDKLQRLNDLFQESTMWVILKSALQKKGYTLIHKCDQELKRVEECARILKHVEQLNNLNWSNWPNVVKYTSLGQLTNDIGMSKVIDSVTHNDIHLDQNELQRFEAYRSAKMSVNDVKDMHDQVEKWDKLEQLLLSTGLTHQTVATFKTHLNLQTIVRVVDEEERLSKALTEWSARRELVGEALGSLTSLDDSRVKGLKKDLDILKRLKELREGKLKDILSMSAVNKQMASILLGLTKVDKPRIMSSDARMINELIGLYKSGDVDLSCALTSVIHLDCLKMNMEKMLQTQEYLRRETNNLDAMSKERERLVAMLQTSPSGTNGGALTRTVTSSHSDALTRTSSSVVDDVIQTLRTSMQRGTLSNINRETMLTIKSIQQEVMTSYTDTSEHMNLRAKLEHIKDHFDRDNIYRLNTEINIVMERLFNRPGLPEQGFNDDFKLEVTSTKESKTTGVVKHEIGLIVRRGEWETNIRGVSGGQADRISLALTIALSNIWGSNFVLIDESMGSLDDETRRVCVQVLRETGKICVCIAHNDIAGMYDHEMMLGG